MSDCHKSPLVDVKTFLQAVILPITQQTTYCTLMDRQTDIKIQGGYKETEREKEGERRGTEADV